MVSATTTGSEPLCPSQWTQCKRICFFWMTCWSTSANCCHVSCQLSEPTRHSCGAAILPLNPEAFVLVGKGAGKHGAPSSFVVLCSPWHVKLGCRPRKAVSALWSCMRSLKCRCDEAPHLSDLAVLLNHEADSLKAMAVTLDSQD